MMQILRSVLVFSAIALAGIANAAAVKADAALRDLIVPHRAIYDIRLARTEDGSGVSSAEGRMVFEVTGGACEGYRMRQRMQVNIGDEEGNVGLLDFRITTFESGDGSRYDFDSRTSVNAQQVEAVKGEARRAGPVIEVSLREPTRKTVTLDGSALFPSQHLQAILDAALARRGVLSTVIYEGAGSGEKSDSATAAIGRAVPGDAHGPLRAGVRHWPVSVGYFEAGAALNPATNSLGEELPSYQMSFSLYENGVTNDLVMDYGNYALAGSLKSIEPLAAPACGR